MPCVHCCQRDENDNFIYEPCCDHSGFCDAGDKKSIDGDIGMCICCGAEMFKEDGYWFHHDQRDIPIAERGTKYYGN